MKVKPIDLVLAGVLAGLSFAVACVGAKAAIQPHEDTSIVEAEWVSNTDTATYFCTEDGRLVWTGEPYPCDDRPYLLTVDRDDNSVLVVWAAQ